MFKYLLLLSWLLPCCLSAQIISGKVTDDRDVPLVGANVYWSDTTIGTTTGTEGEFSLSAADVDTRSLVVSYVGYTSDTLEIGEDTYVEFVLQETEQLSTVVVQAQKEGVIMSNITPIKMEQITQTDLAKAACCDLAGCFGNQTTVQPQTTNVVTNSKELRILGLSGVYNQVLLDGFPMIQGLSYTYGISSIPGTLVENIFVAKGANSVLQGYESMAGQINVITRDPANSERLLLNLYINNFTEKHFNANYTTKVGNWDVLTALHSVQPARRVDRDEDTFLDVPLLTRYMLFNKWKYGNASEWGWNTTIGLRYLHEQRTGGQVGFSAQQDKGSQEVYGQSVQLSQPEVTAKVGYRFDDDDNIDFFLSGFHHQQDSYFGTVRYDAQQTNLYSNLQYEKIYAGHNLKTGISFRHLNLREDIGFTHNDLQRTYAGLYQRQEYIPGWFAENTMRLLNDKLTWIAGVRADRHNQFGWQWAPRTLLKYDFSPNSTLRANVGKGWRTVNLFSENINLLVSSRDVIFAETLQPEETINYGINFTQKFASSRLSGYFSTDYYRTEFQNQIFPDYDTDPTKAIIQNFTGESVGHGWQTELFVRLWEKVELKTGYNFLDVYRHNGETKQTLPFNARHKVLGSFSYRPLSNRFHFDMTLHWYGQQRLPDTRANPVEFQRPDFSENYTIVNAQFTYSFKKLDVYTGCENIFDFRQQRPIIGWQDPFGPYFDTSSVWGPNRGREVYIGVKYKIEAD